MNLSKARELREQRKKLVVDAQALPVETAEQRAVVNQMLDDAEKLKGQIDLFERVENAGQEFRTTPGRTAPPADQPGGVADPNDPEEVKKREARYTRAYMNYLRYGRRSRPDLPSPIRGMSTEDRAILWGAARNISLDVDEQEMINSELRNLGAGREQRDMGTGGGGAYPGSTTGFFVPVGFVNRIEEALKYYGPMLNGGMNMPEIMETSTGQPLPFPTDNDTTVTGELVGEGQQVTSADVTLSQIVFGAFKYSSKLVKVSIELLQDSAFDMETYLVRKFSQRLGRILNNHLTVGNGTTQPNGIITASAAGYTALGSSTNDGTSAGGNTIGSDDLTNLEHSVDLLYRPGAMYMMHDTTLKSIKTVKDKYGRPLWVPGVAVNAPDTINGYRYAVNNDMDQLQSQASSPTVTRKTVLFGQLSKYVVRRVKEMSVLRLEERFADYGQVAFLAFCRYDGDLLDAGTHPDKYLSNIY